MFWKKTKTKQAENEKKSRSLKPVAEWRRVVTCTGEEWRLIYVSKGIELLYLTRSRGWMVSDRDRMVKDIWDQDLIYRRYTSLLAAKTAIRKSLEHEFDFDKERP